MRFFLTALFVTFSPIISATPFCSENELSAIGDKIWNNECRRSMDGLTSWNKGEDFASLGIGHFIWYPESRKDRYYETFPDLLAYLKNNQVNLPQWLEDAACCPWNSREEFLNSSHDPKMIELREFLFSTKALQAAFIAERARDSLSKIARELDDEDKKHVEAKISQLLVDSKGLFAIIDYINFKGEGLSDKEHYNGQGWGLKQVLLHMPRESTLPPLEDFISSAKSVLSIRVENAPKDRGEERWLKGWHNRLDSYKN